VLFDAAESALGPTEILVNNAAYSEGDTFAPPDAGTTNIAGHELVAFTAESFDRHAAVNTRAVGLLMAEFARRHAAREATWGRIINVSTDAAATFPTEVSYGATKYAMESLSRSAACELARFGIRVNVVAPGPIQTGYIRPEVAADVVARIPLGRLGTPEDVADVIVFLASEQARWLTGQTLYAGGGKTM
jgi:3-oxoacyl-[acyl-carrier protein] reductase